MALHGHTKIELTNVETGEVEIYEDDNLVTNGLAELLNPWGRFENRTYGYLYNGNSTGGKEYSHIKALTGGLLLYDSDIPADVNQMYPTTNNKLVGMGTVDRTYDLSNKLAGSYSIPNSGISNNGHSYTHVWNFSTGQANGDIKTVCLTTAAGGIMGTGYHPENTESTWIDSNLPIWNEKIYKNFVSKEYIPLTQSIGYNDRDGWSYLSIDPLYFTKNSIIALDYEKSPRFIPGTNYNNGNRIDDITQEVIDQSIIKNHYCYLKIFSLGIEDFNLFNYQSSTPYSELAIDNRVSGFQEAMTTVRSDIKIELTELKDIITDEMLISNSDWFFNWEHSCDEGFIYIYLNIYKTINGQTAPGETLLHIWKINVEDFSVTYQKILNIINVPIVIKSGNNTDSNCFMNKQHANPNVNDTMSGNAWRRVFYVANDSIFIINPGGLNYIINTTDINNLEVIEIPVDNSYSANWGYFGGYYFFWNCINSTVNSANSYIIATVNSKTGEYMDTGAYIKNIAQTQVNNHTVYFNIYPIYGGNKAPKFIVYSNWYNYYGGPLFAFDIAMFTLPSILITINNLPETITKNSNQTMKVIYTLTEEGY